MNLNNNIDYDQLWATPNTCHTGNTVIFENWNGKKLFVGGWDNGASFDKNTFVIDLTGIEHKYWDVAFAYTANAGEFLPFVNTSYGGWLSLPFPDFSTPSGIKTLEQWNGIVLSIVKQLDNGLDVLVACQGGHGRSGLFCSIVGYLMNIKKDKSWASPVEKLRSIHCEKAVETFSQEKYVYTILGLDIEIKHAYIDTSAKKPLHTKWGDLCPICGNLSYQLDNYGMCATCLIKYKTIAPVRMDLTLDDIDNHQLEHKCDDTKCVGIWRAEKCDHVTHNMIVYDGLCGACWNKQQDEKEYAEKALAKTSPVEWKEPCAICKVTSHYSQKFGVCYTCARDLAESGRVEEIHNSITDPYRYIEHQCQTNNPFCGGIVMGDVCKHVVHDRDIVDGLCPECFAEKHQPEVA